MFRHFSTIFAQHQFSGPFWGALRKVFCKRSAEFPRGEAFLLAVGAFLLTVELLCLQSIEVPFLTHFPTVSKKASTVHKKAKTVSKKAKAPSKKDPQHNCTQKGSTVSRKLPTVSKKSRIHFPEFSGISLETRGFGIHKSCFRGKMKLICWAVVRNYHSNQNLYRPTKNSSGFFWTQVRFTVADLSGKHSGMKKEHKD